MLVLSRRVGEAIYIGDNIEVVITRIDRAAVRVSISAPKDVLIFRGEIREDVRRLRTAFEIEVSPEARRPRRVD